VCGRAVDPRRSGANVGRIVVAHDEVGPLARKVAIVKPQDPIDARRLDVRRDITGRDQRRIDAMLTQLRNDPRGCGGAGSGAIPHQMGREPNVHVTAPVGAGGEFVRHVVRDGVRRQRDPVRAFKRGDERVVR